MKRAERLWIFLLLFLAISGISCSGWLGGVCPSADLLVHFIDVGYGNSILVEFPGGGNLLIDGGDRGAGTKVVEYLKSRKIKKLDVVVVTHPHPDHIEGLFSVVGKYEIDIIIANEDIPESENYAPFFAAIKEQKIEFKRAKREDIIDRFAGVRIEILHPDKLTGDWNNDSLVIKLVYKKVSFLFAADIGQEICAGLVDYYKEKLKSNVVNIPHHGKSGSEEFFELISPELAVLSVGPSKWRNPSKEKEILDILKRLGVRVLTTEREGTIVIRTDGKEVWF